MKIRHSLLGLGAIFAVAFALPAVADWRVMADDIEAGLQAQRTAGRIGAYDIDIGIHLDHVVLKGKVASEADRRVAQEVAEATKGVSDVTNELVVTEQMSARSSGSNQSAVRARPRLPQAPTSDQVLAALARNSIDTSGLDIAVRDGLVTLRGARRSQRDIDAILAVVLMIDGVADINSEMTIGDRPYRTGLRVG